MREKCFTMSKTVGGKMFEGKLSTIHTRMVRIEVHFKPFIKYMILYSIEHYKNNINIIMYY